MTDKIKRERLFLIAFDIFLIGILYLLISPIKILRKFKKLPLMLIALNKFLLYKSHILI